MEGSGESVACSGTPRHLVEIEDETLVFGRPDIGKYEPGYASRYAGLWAFGFATLHSGLDEGLYRTVSSLVAETLAGSGTERPVIVDAAAASDG
jgi:hypothetical protein